MIPLIGTSTLYILNMPMAPEAAAWDFAFPIETSGSAGLYNPAFLLLERRFRVSVAGMYFPVLETVGTFFCFSKNTKYGVTAVSLLYVREGPQGYTTVSPAYEVSFFPYLVSAGFAFSRSFYGVSINLFRYSIFDWASYGAWLSAGLKVGVKWLTVSVSVRNVGMNDRKELLPVSFDLFSRFNIYLYPFQVYPLMGVSLRVTSFPELSVGVVLGFWERVWLAFGAVFWYMDEELVFKKPGAFFGFLYRNWKFSYGCCWRQLFGLDHSISVEVEF